jgi:hypothetical protein
MNYYEKRQAKVILAKLLEAAGYTLHGYKPDTSDIMTDYFSPAFWDGIATKGKYIACIDQKGKTGFEILLNKEEFQNYKNGINGITSEQIKKIQKLKRLAENNAASQGEKENALSKIEAIKNKKIDFVEVKAKYEKLNFPKTNYLIFIYDTEQNCIVYKNINLSQFKEYETQFEIKENKIISGQYRSYETNKLVNSLKDEKIEILQQALNAFLNLDNAKFAYYQTETNEREFIYNETEQKEINENLYIKGYTDKILKLYKKENNRYIYKEIDKKGEFRRTKRYFVLNDTDINKTQFYKQELGFKKAWTKSKRGILIENKTEVKTEVKENSSEIEKEYIININDTQEGFEVKFNKKPPQKILEALKNNGFRWSSFNKLWYIKQNKIKLESIKKILDN